MTILWAKSGKESLILNASFLRTEQLKLQVKKSPKSTQYKRTAGAPRRDKLSSLLVLTLTTDTLMAVLLLNKKGEEEKIINSTLDDTVEKKLFINMKNEATGDILSCVKTLSYVNKMRAFITIPSGKLTFQFRFAEKHTSRMHALSRPFDIHIHAAPVKVF